MGDRTPRVGGMARGRAAHLWSERRRQHLALVAAPARSAHRRPAVQAAWFVPGRQLLQQFSAEQHRRRRRPHRGHGESRGLENAGDHRRPGRSRAWPDGARAGCGRRRHHCRTCASCGDAELADGPVAGVRRGCGAGGAGGFRARTGGTCAAAADHLSRRVGRGSHRTADRGAREVPRQPRADPGLLRRRRVRAGQRWWCSTSPSPTRCTSTWR